MAQVDSQSFRPAILADAGMAVNFELASRRQRLRALAQSDRFDQAWALLAVTYRAEVRMFEKVVPLHAKRR